MSRTEVTVPGGLVHLAKDEQIMGTEELDDGRLRVTIDTDDRVSPRRVLVSAALVAGVGVIGLGLLWAVDWRAAVGVFVWSWSQAFAAAVRRRLE